MQTTNRAALFILVAILMIAGAVQAQNMLNFPYYHHDEGTHIANSWTIATTGQLSPYTYSYEDPPAGSLMLGLWNKVFGESATFGFPINSGRVLMLVMHPLTVALVFLTARKMASSDLAGAVAALVFAFSPLATALQRLVFLENIMIVWLLLAFFLVVGDGRTLQHYFASAFFMGLAILTKGSAIYFLPALFLIVLFTAHRHHRRFAITLWTAITLLIIVTYPLFAQMKEELFPQDWVLGGDFPHVSLVERLGDRGPDTGRFLNAGSGLDVAVKEWVDVSKPTADPVLVYGGLVSFAFVLILALEDRWLRALLVMALAAGLNLLFGGPVYKIDAILFLPLLAIGVGVIVGKTVDWVNQGNDGNPVRYALMAGLVTLLVYPFWSFNSSRLDVYTADQVNGQIEAVSWSRQNLPENAVIVTDNFAFVELRQTHPNTHDYWHVDTDPAVKFSILEDDVCNIDYLITTPRIYSDTTTFKLELTRRAIEGSALLATYENNGWPIEIRQVNKSDCLPQLASSEVSN
ncbi:MAG: phospholipid carrier-dependent glycosyltransferase [Chloroflexi bacterium]|nr:phospholipid carrier-dependent glycosyltransferase [Chloroflexota bacterium]